MDMNQRYEMLEERLLDRQQELQGMLGSVKSFLQDLADILSWLDTREKDLDESVAVATSEKEAKRRLKDHEVWSICISHLLLELYIQSWLGSIL